MIEDSEELGGKNLGKQCRRRGRATRGEGIVREGPTRLGD